MRISLLALSLSAIAAPTEARVVLAGASGFEIEHRVDTALAPDALYRLMTDVGSWWSDEHTYSGKASNLSLVAQPGGCWCEKLADGGGVEHMRVAQVQPGRRLLLTGSLGPLVFEGASGVLQLTIEPKTAGATLVMNYRVGGFYKGDGTRLAAIVDTVLAEQIKRLSERAGQVGTTR